MKIDPYNHKKYYLIWREENKHGIPNLSEFDSKLILDYLYDMENGLNVAMGSRKGSRSYIRLNGARKRLVFLFKHFEEKFNLSKVSEIEEKQLHIFFTEMRNGDILKSNGTIYKSVGDFVKDFKALWHWYQKINKKKGIEIMDITSDLDTSKEKPDWV